MARASLPGRKLAGGKTKGLTKALANRARRGGVGKPGSCHLFRHTMATLMLEGGADIRHVQQMLGHVNIASTQIYTRVSLRSLESVHSATHPGAANTPPSVRRGAEEGEEQRPGRTDAERPRKPPDAG